MFCPEAVAVKVTHTVVFDGNEKKSNAIDNLNPQNPCIPLCLPHILGNRVQ